MAILIDQASRFLLQGITGSTGRSFAERMVRFQSGLVAGVTPGKEGQRVWGVPVFDSVLEAKEQTAATLSLIVVPPSSVLDAVMEASDAGIELTVVYTEGVPVQDAMRAYTYARARGLILCGPNSAGIVSPGKANLSDLNEDNLTPGRIGIVSKSGTLTYEVILELRRLGFGVSTVVCLGGDPFVGLDYRSVLERFDRDAETDAVVLIGEIGGEMEAEAAETVKRMRKPVVTYIAGHSAPRAKRMGHAGAIMRSRAESAEEKTRVLQAANAYPVSVITEIAPFVHQLFR